MVGKRRLEQLLAAAAYDELSPEEQVRLSRHMDRDPALAAEADALKRLVTTLPNDPPPFQGNLLPAIHAQLAAGPVKGQSRAWGRLMGYGIAAACVVGAFGAALVQPGNGGNPTNAAMTVADYSQETAVSGLLAQAESLRQRGDAAGAYALLNAAIANHPEDAYAADAQLALASLAFEDLQWYSEAEEAYNAYARDFTTNYLMHPESATIAFRRNLLAEARASGYEPLYALMDAGTVLPELERILARHPAGFVAIQAAEQMLAAVPHAASDLEALEQLRLHCSDPVALAHLDVELAERYALDLGDGTRARALLEDVARRQESHYAAVAAQKLLLLSSE